MEAAAKPSFLQRHEFLLRRLHSLSGVVPVGAYMCVHLLTNASVNDSPAAFQRAVYQIHSLGAVLPVVEWVFIFIPILFHGILGLAIIREGVNNYSAYPYASNARYSLQRATGMIAFFFILWHVFHMHGWLHADWWMENVAGRLQGGLFKPYNAASTAGAAMQASLIVPIAYAVGVLACVFHLANGLWTFGITWGLWTSPAAQRRATALCAGFGLLLAMVGMAALWGMVAIDVEQARKVEDRMFEAKAAAGEVDPDSHKKAHDHPAAPDDDEANATARR